jgi:hypothetical protein
MIRRLSLACILVLPLGLGACASDPAFTGATPVSYDGVWTGVAQTSQGGERTCPSPTPFVVTIANNAVRGEVRDRRNRNVTVSRFDGVVDADGRITARAWYDSIRNDLSLQYNGTRFSGTITNPNECVFNLRLNRG